MSNYLISICIPSFNRDKEIYKSVKKILECYTNSKEIEICVSDNCSTDNTAILLNEFKQYSNFSFNRNSQNMKFDYNLLKVAKMANGEYVLFLGDDDELQTEYLNEIISILKLKVGIEAIFSNYSIQTSNRAIFKSVYKIENNIYNSNMNKILELGHFITFMSSIIIKRKLIDFREVKKYEGYKFMHIAIVLNSLRNSNNILIYKNSLVHAFDNGLSNYNIEKYFEEYLMYIIDSESHYYNIKSIDIFKNSVFDFIVNPTLICNRSKSFFYYKFRYSNKKVYLLLMPKIIYREFIYKVYIKMRKKLNNNDFK